MNTRARCCASFGFLCWCCVTQGGSGRSLPALPSSFSLTFSNFFNPRGFGREPTRAWRSHLGQQGGTLGVRVAFRAVLAKAQDSELHTQLMVWPRGEIMPCTRGLSTTLKPELTAQQSAPDTVCRGCVQELQWCCGQCAQQRGHDDQRYLRPRTRQAECTTVQLEVPP